MAQDRDYRHWDEDWRGRRSQGEGEGYRSREGGYGGGRMESGFSDRGSNRYGGRDEWRASGPRSYGAQDESSWRGQEEDRWSRGWGAGEREHSGWGERAGRGEYGGSSFGGGDWGDRGWRGMGSGGMGSGGMGSGGLGSAGAGSGGMASGAMGSGAFGQSGYGGGALGAGGLGGGGFGAGSDWSERDRWRDREQGQYSGAGLTGGESGYFGGGPRHYGEHRGEYRGSGRGGYSSGQSGYGSGYGYSGRSPSYGERSYGGRGGDERGFWDRASDEVQSWFGDEEAQHRRERDYERDHRGRGPRGYTRSDDRIREDVCDRLEQDPRVDASDIDVKVSSGEVSLEGHVDSRMAKRRAEDCAEMISGVRHVQNNLRVQEYSGAMGSGVATGGTSASGTSGAAGASSGTGASATSGTGSSSTSRTTGSSGGSGTSGGQRSGS